MDRQETKDEEKGTGFSLKGFAGYSFPYCQSGTLNEFKDLYPVRIDLERDDVVQVQFSAFARGEFIYTLMTDPTCSLEELMNSERALKTPWEEVQPGAIDAGPWYTMFTASFFKASEKGLYTFAPRLRKSIFSGKYAVHHQNILAHILGKGPVMVFEGSWPR